MSELISREAIERLSENFRTVHDDEITRVFDAARMTHDLLDAAQAMRRASDGLASEDGHVVVSLIQDRCDTILATFRARWPGVLEETP